MEVGVFLEANFNGILITLLGWIYMKFPPKRINQLYGYRTRRSMANQEIWDFANVLGAKMIFYLGLALLSLGTILYFFLPIETIFLITIFTLLFGLAVGFYWCETQLNKRFDKNGHPKKHPS
jgi:uncharacterized membrane protein